MTHEFLFYCRSGYEADLSSELEHKLARQNRFGYGRFSKDKGFLRFQITPSGKVQKQDVSIQSQCDAMPRLSSIIFARQKTLIISELSFSNMRDRVGEVVEGLQAWMSENAQAILFGDVRVEYPDTESGKEIAKFSKKFTVPLRSALRKNGVLSKQQSHSLPYLHVFFEQGDACILAISMPGDRSEDLLGIKRLKFPADAPSRSTLKLEEAITLFCTKQQEQALFQTGMSAVDLGACPGGWTYQLVSRGLRVEAVDNGAMDDKLMQSGLVSYHAADGFTYTPKDKHVDWLVCDMIEKPDRVAKLMTHWLTSRLASAAIFNLKLPMKKRYLTLAPLIEEFEAAHKSGEQDFLMCAKHLYHNRDEVTFMIIKNSQMVAEFASKQVL
ncbi:23S rRNA (cytidine(2498)-2'-O)-methyltransferase RlmM [Glaciecola siphonariae]|uniref:23S rRNA (Cytidine(2498)-2'-O)-methyltransferase RlmM n=1 Tax=Glaciecola siphonariae TaxID=521012 RepID=A0ABV9LUN6_9ALTE